MDRKIPRVIFDEMVKEAKLKYQENIETVKESHPELNVHEQRMLASLMAEESVFGNTEHLRK